MSEPTPNHHNPDEDGWCQNEGCMWNVWGARSTPGCPVRLPKRADYIGQQEDMLRELNGEPLPTPNQGELEQQIFDIIYQVRRNERMPNVGMSDKVACLAITAQVQAAEDRGCREALKHLQTLLDDPWYHHDTERLQALRNEMAALGDSHE